MAIYCSVDPPEMVEIDHPPSWLSSLVNDVQFSGQPWGIPDGTYRRIDDSGHYLGWMQARIERAYAKIAASPNVHGVDVAKLESAVSLYWSALRASGITPCRPDDIPAGYGPPIVPGAIAAFVANDPFSHEAGRGRGGGGYGGAAGGGGLGGGQAALSRRSRAVQGRGDGGREWQAGLMATRK